MIQAVSGIIRKEARYLIHSKDGRPTRWRTDFIGQRGRGAVEDHPQAFLIEMEANSSISTHFHQVDQFQVLVAGSGTLGTESPALIALHYVDHHTINGPTRAGPYGLSILTVRTQCDPGATHLQFDPDYEQRLKQSKHRYFVASGIALSIEPVLRHRATAALEDVLAPVDAGDGLGAYMLRVGASGKVTGPDPSITAGQFYLVLNGELNLHGIAYPPWSTVYLKPAEPPLEIVAGAEGVEALVLNFPRPQP